MQLLDNVSYCIRTKIFVIQQAWKLQPGTILTNPRFASHTHQDKGQQRHQKSELWYSGQLPCPSLPAIPVGFLSTSDQPRLAEVSQTLLKHTEMGTASRMILTLRARSPFPKTGTNCDTGRPPTLFRLTLLTVLLPSWFRDASDLLLVSRCIWTAPCIVVTLQQCQRENLSGNCSELQLFSKLGKKS